MVSLGDIVIKHEESTAAHALEGISEGVKATNTEQRTERTRLETRRSESPPAKTKKAPNARQKSSKKVA